MCCVHRHFCCRKCPLCFQCTGRFRVCAQVCHKLHSLHAPPGKLVFHCVLGRSSAPEQHHGGIVLGDDHCRRVGAAYKVDVHHIPAESIAQPDGNSCRQQDAWPCHPQPYPPVERQPAQQDQHQTHDGCIGRIEVDARARFCRDPDGPAVEQAGQRRRRCGQHPIQRSKSGYQAGKGRAKAQQHYGLDEPQHRRTGCHRINAHTQPAQHQHRECGHRSTKRDANAFRKAPKTFLQFEIPWALHRVLCFLPEAVVPRIPGAADAHTACHRAHHRRKRKFKADIAHCIAVACGHNDTCHRQRGKGIRRAVQPHTQCTDPDRHCGAAYRGCEAGHAHQQKGQQTSEYRPASAPAVALLPLVGQECAEDITAQNGHMHSAYHQHMGKTRAPVGAAHGRRQITPVAGSHGSQHTAGLAVHTAAQRRTEPLLQAVGAGAEAAAFAQNCKLRPILVHFRLQSDAVRIQADPASGCRGRQYKSSLHPFPGFALRQSTALHPEGFRAAVHFLYMQNRIHDTGIVGIRRAFHLCGQHQRTACILHPDALQPVCRVQHRCHTHSSTQQDAERCFAGSIKDAQHQTNGNKKCRKRHKKFRLRQKNAH